MRITELKEELLKDVKEKSKHILPTRTMFKFGDSERNDWNIFAEIVANGYTPVFEFGTFRGCFIEVLALNSKEPVYTLDIGNSDILDLDRGDYEKYGTYQAGEVFKNKPIEKNIIQLIGNSKEFDFSNYYNKFKFIFLDGGHNYEVCKSDSLNALKMIKSKGVIVWDDANWPDVAKCIQELRVDYDIKDCGRYAYYIKGEN